MGSWQQLIDAGHLAARIPGVIGVVNRLEVEGGPPSGVGALPPPLGQPFLEGAPGHWLRRWSKPRRYDVVVIGAGVIGAAIARELSRFRLRVALVEKEWDVAMGASSANNGMVHPGVNATPGSLKARLNVRGNALYSEVAAELGIAFERCGLIGCVLHEGDRDALSRVAHRARKEPCPRVSGYQSR